MKNILLLAFLFISCSAFAQKNEIVASHQVFQKDQFGKSLAVSYFRNFSQGSAIGIRVNYNVLDDDYYYSDFHSGNIDIINRWNISKSKKVRFMPELGISALRVYQEGHSFLFCGNLGLGERIPFMEEGWNKRTYYGFTGGLGIDFQIFTFLKIGTSYTINAYRTNQELYYQEDIIYRKNLSLNLGVNF